MATHEWHRSDGPVKAGVRLASPKADLLADPRAEHLAGHAEDRAVDDHDAAGDRRARHRGRVGARPCGLQIQRLEDGTRVGAAVQWSGVRRSSRVSAGEFGG